MVVVVADSASVGDQGGMITYSILTFDPIIETRALKYNATFNVQCSTVGMRRKVKTHTR